MDDYLAFTQLVHGAYPRLHDRVFLQDHPLLRLLGGSSPLDAERLHRTLIGALEWLRPLGTTSPASVEWRRYRHLQLRYLDGATPEQVAHELQVSPRQARRDHVDALDEIARLLWERLVQARAENSPGPRIPGSPSVSRGMPDPAAAQARASPRSSDPLDAEISKLGAATAVAPTQIDPVIRGAVETMSRLAQSNSVRISIDLSASPELVTINRTAVRQILLNLLSDVVVHHPGAAVDVRTDHSGGALAIIMTLREGANVEAGPGNAEATIGVSSAVLAVSQRLAESQGATLTAEACADQLTFRLTLSGSTGSTLLLIDDNPDVALLFRRYLGETKYQVVQARSAERALRLARELQPCAIILDVLMPMHDGWEILQALRAEPATAKLPVVVCSVIPDHALAYSLGVTDFLSKPVTRSALLGLLARLPRAVGAEDGDDSPGPPGSSDTALPRAIRPTG